MTARCALHQADCHDRLCPTHRPLPPLPEGLPAICEHLPQRAAAYSATRQLADSVGWPEPEISERMDGERVVRLEACAPNGRAYGIGYEWTPEQEQRYAPRKPWTTPTVKRIAFLEH